MHSARIIPSVSTIELLLITISFGTKNVPTGTRCAGLYSADKMQAC
jgi:hypothetical protein